MYLEQMLVNQLIYLNTVLQLYLLNYKILNLNYYIHLVIKGKKFKEGKRVCIVCVLYCVLLCIVMCIVMCIVLCIVMCIVYCMCIVVYCMCIVVYCMCIVV